MAEYFPAPPHWSPYEKPPSFTASRPRTPGQQSSSASVRSKKSFRERTSFFFNRSKSNATPGRREVAEEDEVPVPMRPNTSQTTQSTRRVAEPLDTIRHSILGSKRRNQSVASIARSDSNASFSSARNDSVSSIGRETFQKEDEYYRHLRKQSISPPFHFEHVTHTSKTSLPPLETVDEQDLPREFWSVSARQRPKRHLNGISATDIPRQTHSSGSDSSRPGTSKSRPVSPLSPSELGDDPPHINTPVEPIARLDDTIFDAVAATNQNTLTRSRSVPHFPRRYSSLTAMKGEDGTTPPHRQLTTFYESDSSSVSGGRDSPEDQQEEHPNGTAPVAPVLIPHTIPRPKQDDIFFRSKQPLPPIPSRHSSRNLSKASSRSGGGYLPPVSLQIPSEHAWSPKSKQSSKRSSKRSSRSSRSLRKSPSQSSSTGVRQSTIVSDTTWEDDVDYCYEQEAESTCNFNWGTNAGGSEHYLLEDDELNLATSPYHAHSPTIAHEAGPQIRVSNNKDTIAERRMSRRIEEPARAPSSVGHRGFLAARRSSTDLSRHIPTPVQITPSSSTPDLLSPVLSVNGEEKQTTPKPLHDSGVGSLNAPILSRADSRRTSAGPRHHKSSSHGSNASSARASSRGNRESKRWSIASGASNSELNHGGARHKVVLSKTIISAPLESLPQSPPYERDTEAGQAKHQPNRDSFVMRRPQDPQEHAVWQAAGRAAHQRGSSRQGMHRHRESQVIHGSVRMHDGGLGWI
ncbi:uncharacterized protein LTR77_008398 [Saxophila tyrrhenica]|uniref:CRIB domain-containing protein n=1 Tax=Saxophila tyrrhenica TaxID=1690608 RepID=A0AAV9P3R3_9PEZI|nr:hypothetical protein LTR77_008398 [Saxophila tyrrhenica]